ncbi:bifunctional allose-6-phosphate isomerase/ribose-5-phosphate isomerase RpiB [Citrobacter freundii]|uniref:bifunctional allose-6-phosphate isomerase/ribose-5-phosphate isomerase RpiB n=1 Tax=unclassified Citrobacter TaxID=2644389 RepID=UPI001A33C963|nr:MULTISPECIES: bifunctional allose-6-phosphate isomerase/ribose-5-phosphate isomerase RpiB [Citrobacter]MCQ7058914.1 ribose 5-phosphate isomerase B [Escherichia coli]MDK2361631.1 bifunctional allose-6-phosphate isomerase/ribose-5-phosphate isomerase RpiB [Citrobacter freundii]MDM2927338.1 bifunctional allose-6-phosphate isomerase/ribose-5-phosphate isomerase RpiB [Citrobacter sp. Cm046]MDM2940878.1 bifunctional allose-6-phosphate isomerase/ribose-5-phosphate isomerase RpiB [Citrobacter sp. Cm
MKKIAFGCDHVGFILKSDIFKHLAQRGIEVIDKGTYSSERTDYPRYASEVAQAVVTGEVDGGILICGTGVGISITANKFAGIRAVVCSEPYSAQLSRQHNDSNVLAFGSRVVGLELAKMIVDAWLDAVFEGGRHQQRVETIMAIERRRN